MNRIALLIVLLGVSARPALSQDVAFSAAPGGVNDYPTATRAEYVFACMQTNGGTSEALKRCSCAIDVIASVLPYADYEKAETVLRMRRQAGGGIWPNNSAFR